MYLIYCHVYPRFNQFGFRLRNLWHIVARPTTETHERLMTCFVTKGHIMIQRDIVDISVVDTDNLLDFDDMTHGDADFLT